MNLRPGAALPLLILLPCIFCTPPAASQSVRSDTTRADTVRTDTSAAERGRAERATALRPDSLVKPLISIPYLGSVDRSIEPAQVIDDSERNFMEYEHLADLLSMTPGVFTFGLGTPGEYQGLTMQGVGARGIAILSDGILLNEPYSGTHDLNLYPLEDADRVEIIPDTRSFLYGFNAAGGAINIVNRSRRAVHPFSHIRYSDDGYGYSLLDGMISEDIIRGLNTTAGVNHTTTGGRFPNSDYDAWSGRLRLRYDLTSGLNFFGSGMYDQSRLDLNGGLDASTLNEIPAEGFQASVRNTDSYEKRTRSELRLGFALNPPSDSNAIHTLTLYYSNNLREFRDEENRPGANGTFLQQNQESRWYGMRASGHRIIGNSMLDFGGEIQHRRVRAGPPGDGGSFTNGEELASSRYDFFGKAGFRFPGAVTASAYGRFDHADDQERFAAGADGAISFPGSIELFGGVSRSFRFPTIQEIEGTPPVLAALPGNDAEEHRLVEAGIRLNPSGGSKLELKAFHRTIEDVVTIVPQLLPLPATPYAFSRSGTLVLRGVDGSGALRLGSFFVEGVVQYLNTPGTENGTAGFPLWTGSGGIYFWDTLFGGHLNLKVGVRGSFFSAYEGRGFDDLAMTDVPTGAPFPIDPSGKGDFFLIAHLGNAYVHFVWENLTNRQYIMRVFYPMPDRSIRFGVSWDFMN
ncbi:MAG TPA: TonB-dependent receptor [Bacteroidota bacterium]